MEMLNFDRSLVYQFGLFLGKIDEDRKDLSQLLPVILQAEVSGIQIPIRFGEPALGTALEMTPSGPQERPVLIWLGGGGIWRLQFAPSRIDLFFDARGQADIRVSTPLLLSEVGNRVIPNIQKAIDELGLPVVRPALVLKGEAKLNREESVRLVSERFLNHDFIESYKTGELFEASAKATLRREFSLSDKRKLPVNLIETGRAVWSFQGQGTAGQHHLEWQFDVNSAPEAAIGTTLAGEEFGVFSGYAIKWIEERLP